MTEPQASLSSTNELTEDGTFAVHAARVLSDARCQNVQVLDVRGLSQMTDYLVLATGVSDRQMRSAVDDLADVARQDEQKLLRRHGESGSTWIVADFANVMVHLFTAESRLFYDLESLWGDSRPVDWKSLTEAGQFAHLAHAKKRRQLASEPGVDSPGVQE